MRTLVVSCALLCMLSVAARADQVTDQLQQGRDYYKQGDLSGAVNELQFAIQDIRSQLATKYREGFPPAPAGWSEKDDTSDNGAAMALLGGGVSVTRNYAQTDGSGTIDATISVDNPMIQAMAGIIANPAVVAATPGMKRVRVGRDSAVVTFEPGGDSGEANMVVAGRIMLQLQGHGLADDKLVEQMIKGFDVDALKKQAGI